MTPSGSVTYAELADRVEAMAASVDRLGAPGDRMAVVGDNSVDYVVALYAVPRARRVLALVNQRLHPVEQRRLVERVHAVAVLGDPGRLDVLRGVPADAAAPALMPFDAERPPTLTPPPPATAGPDDPAWLIHTSGTTGPAKGVPLTQGNLRAAIEAGARGRPVVEGDVYLFPFPLCHVAAYNVLLQHDRGATVVLPAGFDAGDVLAAVPALGVTTMSLAPTMIVRLLDHPDRASTDLGTLRSVGYGAAALPPAARRRAERLLGCSLVEGYGMTELSGNAVFDGVVDPAIELRLVDDVGRDVEAGRPGEIVARGPQVMHGYVDDGHGNGDAFVDGWFRTGDIGRFDPEGRLTIVDRRKDIIITGGENVASREVEDVLAGHPDIADVAVVGAPDPEWGERIVAVIVAAPDAADGLAERAVAHCRGELAGFKTPRQVELVESLPVNDNGKVDKRALRDLVRG